MTIKRRDIEVFSLSFLDIISCGFGAIILLLVLSMALEPATRVRMQADLSGEIRQIEQDRVEVIARSQTLQDELENKRATVESARQVVQKLENDLKSIEDNDQSTVVEALVQAEEQMKVVLQDLTDEMERLQKQKSTAPPGQDAVIGGIPVDSEYIVFVIDTSGSMQSAAWRTVLKKVEEVLEVHPNVKGLQVVNDMGNYMFRAYAGRWIPDSKARRREVIRELRTWKPYSNSNPVEGLKHVLRTYSKVDGRLSIFFFGDDFSAQGGSFEKVLSEVGRINKRDAHGNTRVRIHAFGFPVLLFGHLVREGSRQGPRLDDDVADKHRSRFAHLMRLLAEQNSGSFVGLTDRMDK